MDLRFTPEELAFREEVRAFIRENLPADTRDRMKLGHPPRKEDTVRWQRILNAKGWAALSWPKEWGGPGWSAIRHSATCVGPSIRPRISPSSGVSKPMMCLSRTLLPLPLGPMTTKISPASTFMSMPCKTGTPPKLLRRPRTSTVMPFSRG